MKMDTKVITLLKKVLNKLLSDPDLMFGHDVSVDEIDYVKIEKKLPIKILQNLGSDHFFFFYHEKFGLTETEGEFLDFYFEHRLEQTNLN